MWLELSKPALGVCTTTMGSDDDEGEWPLQLPVGKCARLAYGPDFKHDDVLLLEMDEAILQEALVDGCVHPHPAVPAVRPAGGPGRR